MIEQTDLLVEIKFKNGSTYCEVIRDVSVEEDIGSIVDIYLKENIGIEHIKVYRILQTYSWDVM